MKRFALLFGFCLGVIIVPASKAGNISGVVKELKGKPVRDAQIVVRDLGSNIVIDVKTSGTGGEYNLPLPNGTAISIEFSHPDHLPAALVGISGNANLPDFTVFMPLREIQLCDSIPCVSRDHFYSRKLFRRGR